MLHENHTQINDEFKLIKLSWKNYKKSKQYISDMSDTLNNAIYGQDDAIMIKRIAKWINTEMQGYCFGFEGPWNR